MGHKKLRKFAENKTFSCLIEADSRSLLENGYANLKDAPIKGNWNRDMFGANNAPIILELGCGKGEYTINLAHRKPNCNYIGVDIKGARLWKGAKQATEESLSNVAFLRTRIEFISAFFAPGEVDEIWLTFSDPQYKSENSRLCSPVFLERFSKFLKPGGIIHLKTDSMFLHQYCKAVCKANNFNILAFCEDVYGSNIALDDEVRSVQTFYETMFLQQGYKITYIAFTLGSEIGRASSRNDGKNIIARNAFSSLRGAAGDEAISDHYKSPSDFDSDYWRSIEGPRLLFGHDSAETKRQKLK